MPSHASISNAREHIYDLQERIRVLEMENESLNRQVNDLLGNEVHAAEAEMARATMKRLVYRYLNYHNGLARCESGDYAVQCTCGICFEARPLMEANP